MVILLNEKGNYTLTSMAILNILLSVIILKIYLIQNNEIRFRTFDYLSSKNDSFNDLSFILLIVYMISNKISTMVAHGVFILFNVINILRNIKCSEI